MNLNKLVDYFVPQRYLNDNELLRKSRFIVWFVFITNLIGIFFSFLILAENPEDTLNLLFGMLYVPLFIVGLFIFRKKGSFIFTTHYMCGIFFSVMCVMPSSTGGIFSPDLPTIYFLPIFALIMGSYGVGLFYAVLTTIVFLVYYYGGVQDDPFFRNQTLILKADYYFFNLFLNFLVISFLVFRNEKIRLKILEELRLNNVIITQKSKEITDSITYAKRIQNAILPPIKLFDTYLPNSFVIYKPKDIVAGDFYWINHKQDTVYFAAADCTGHGVPGALVSVICNNSLNRALSELGACEPGILLDKTRQIVINEFEKSEEDVKDGMDIALCALKGKTLHYSGAHNPLWLIRKGAVEVEEIKGNKQPVGNFSHSVPFTSHTIETNSGDSLYIFSDGFVDQFGGEQGKKFKASNLKKLLLSIQHLEIADQKQAIEEAFEQWKGSTEQIDDVCLIGVKLS